MKRKILLILGIMIVCLLIGVSFYIYRLQNKKEVREQESKVSYVTEFGFDKISIVTDIIEEKEIAEISEHYNLGDAGEIEKLIFIPLSEEEEAQKIDVGKDEDKYYIKQLGMAEKMEKQIFSSWYEAASGERKMDEIYEIEFEFPAVSKINGGNETMLAELSKVYQFESVEWSSVLDKCSIEVEAGNKRNMKAYLYENFYTYEVWKSRLWDDTLVGEGTLAKPVGILVILGKNLKLSEPS